MDGKIFDYFIVMGLDEDKVNSLNDIELIKKLDPQIISYFSYTNIEKLNDEIKSMINNLKANIFPTKSNFFNKFSQQGIDEKIEKSIYEDFITTSCPKEYFYSFSSFYSINNTLTIFHFGILIFYEEILKNYYAAKCLILVSKQPFYILFNKILDEIYKQYLNPTDQPLELFISTIYNTLHYKKNKSNLIKFFNFEYFIPEDSFLPFFDLNLYAFFNNFTLLDFLKISEQFLRRLPILLISSNPSLLFPTFFSIMNLMYPLNVTNQHDYYIYLSHLNSYCVLPSTEASFVSICSDNITNEDLKIVISKRGLSTLVINLDTQSLVYYRINEENEISQVQEKELEETNIFKHIFENFIVADINLLALIDTRLRSKKKIKCGLLDYLSLRDENIHFITGLRKQFFSVFSKFLMFNIPFTQIEVNLDDSSQKIKIIFDEKSDLKDDLIKDFYSYFKLTPSYDIIYKSLNNIENQKNLIILDELIKIMKSDERRLYFDQCLNIPEEINFTSEVIKINEYASINTDLGKDIYRNLNKNGYFFTNNDKIKYTKFKLYFDEFNLIYENILYKDVESILNFRKKNNILLDEINAFIYLINTETLIINNSKLVIAAIIIALLSLTIFTNGMDKKKVLTIIDLFETYKGFENKFGFVCSLVYSVIILDENIRSLYEERFLKNFKDFNILPSLYILRKANKISKGHVSNEEDEVYGVRIVQELQCINECKLMKESFIYNNLRSPKCSSCNQEEVLFLNTQYGKYDDCSGPLISPLKLLLILLQEIVNNQSLKFNRRICFDSIFGYSCIFKNFCKDEISLLIYYSRQLCNFDIEKIISK